MNICYENRDNIFAEFDLFNILYPFGSYIISALYHA